MAPGVTSVGSGETFTKTDNMLNVGDAAVGIKDITGLKGAMSENLLDIADKIGNSKLANFDSKSSSLVALAPVITNSESLNKLNNISILSVAKGLGNEMLNPLNKR